MTTRADVIASARKTLGTPWIHMGRTLGRGFDCVGVLLFVMHDLGLSDYEPGAYQRNARWNDFLTHFIRNGKQIDLKDMKPGDALVLRQQGPYPCHCGVLAEKDGQLRIIHSRADWGKVVEEPYSAQLRRITRAAFQFSNLDDA